MRKFKRRIRSIIAIILLPAICWLFTNATIFQHSHILDTGETITHAHPYSADKNPTTPFQSHSHSKTSILLLSTISNPAVILGLIISILGIDLFRTASIRFVFIERLIQRQFFQLHNSRGPPNKQFI